MKNIYIHIGIHKTGSTSIQHFLYSNRELLKKHGYEYPEIHIAESAHHLLAGQLVKDCGLSVFQPPGDISDPAAFDVLTRWKDLNDHLAQTEYENIVLSSEEFEWLTLPGIIRDLLGEHNYKIIVYVRRPDKYLESLYQQFVKDTPIRLVGEIRMWVRAIQETSRIHDFSTLIDRWEAAFGRDNLRVAVFEDEIKRVLEKGFLRYLDLPDEVSDEYIIPGETWLQRQKSGMDARCVEVLRLCNQEGIPKREHKVLLKIMMRLSNQLKVEGTYCKDMLALKLRNDIMNDIEASNDAIRAKYFPQAPFLFPSIDDDDIDSNIPIKSIVAFLVRMCLKNNDLTNIPRAVRQRVNAS